MLSARWEEAVEAIEEYLQISPHDPNIDMRYTRSLLETERYQQAIDVIDTQSDEDMKVYSGNYYFRGYCYLKLGELKKAEENMLTFLRYVENDCNTFDRLIEIYQAMGRADLEREIKGRKSEKNCGS
jgi:tetratricopeptide (TPR) repeat protein